MQVDQTSDFETRTQNHGRKNCAQAGLSVVWEQQIEMEMKLLHQLLARVLIELYLEIQLDLGS